MIIVSQDKSEIINFDKVQNIYVSGRFISLNFELNNYEVIGTYKTEERAKEVLREIVDTFGIREIRNSTYQYADLAIKSRKYSIYEMPES